MEVALEKQLLHLRETTGRYLPIDHTYKTASILGCSTMFLKQVI